MMKVFLILSLFVLLTSCIGETEKKEDAKSLRSEKSPQMRESLRAWVKERAGDSEKLRLVLEDLAQTRPESCDFKYKVQCVEGLIGFDEALEIEIELMERLLDTKERQQRFDENIQKCHFNGQMNKIRCAYE